MDAASTNISDSRELVGSAFNRQICISHHSSVVQFDVQRPRVKRGGWINPTRLGTKLPILSNTQSTTKNEGNKGDSNDNMPQVAKSTLVQNTQRADYSTTHQGTKQCQIHDPQVSKARTHEESEMEY